MTVRQSASDRIRELRKELRKESDAILLWKYGVSDVNECAIIEYLNEVTTH